MNFTKRDLRNNESPLLRRIQRQLDKKESERLFEEVKVKPMKLCSDNFLMDFAEEEFVDTPTFKPKKTRLGLFENRRGNR